MFIASRPFCFSATMSAMWANSAGVGGNRRKTKAQVICLATVWIATLVSATLPSTSAVAEVILSNAPTGGTLWPFGRGNSLTYGQVFTAPISGTLDSFSLYLNGGVGALHAGVGLWNGTAVFDYGFGEASNLYTSSSVASLGAGPYTFAPGIGVIAGQQYVAYISVYGEAGASYSGVEMPLGTNVSGIDYLVWNNTSNPMNNPSWNYFFNAGDALFEASFSPVPEPSTYAMAVAGLACAAWGAVRKQRAGRVDSLRS